MTPTTWLVNLTSGHNSCDPPGHRRSTAWLTLQLFCRK